MAQANTIKNPIIPGFYSDPSVCRDGEDYYLINSSFEFYPGVPVFHSRDLVNWDQISYCLDRPSQLPLQAAGTSDGIYAPTIRKYKDTFYMITSNRSASQGNHFFVTASNPAGPWSDPVWIYDMDGNIPGGVDPSLFFDDDGTVYFSCVAWDENGQGIGQAVIDITTGRLTTPISVVWHGTGATFPEGPHTYKRNGYYYLMIAEGGTEFGHKVCIARASSINGPYTSCPRNPILTQIYQYAQSCPIQGVGHGDLFEAHDGSWWMIVHGFRPSVGKLHHLGRETLLVPVIWDEDGWPVANKNGWIDESVTLQGEFSHALQKPVPDTSDFFNQDILPLYWNYLRNPLSENYCMGPDIGGLSLRGCPHTLDGEGQPTWLGRRQQHFNCIVTARMSFSPSSEKEEAGLTVYQTPEHHYDLVVTKCSGRKAAYLRKTAGDMKTESSPVWLGEGEMQLEIKSDRLKYTFSIRSGGNTAELGSGRTQLISTEAMLYQNFTGTYLAMYAISLENISSEAVFTEFTYSAEN